jgi:hypothetical protein
MNTYTHAQIHADTHAPARAHTLTQTRILTHTHTHSLTHTHTHPHSLTHTRNFSYMNMPPFSDLIFRTLVKGPFYILLGTLGLLQFSQVATVFCTHLLSHWRALLLCAHMDLFPSFKNLCVCVCVCVFAASKVHSHGCVGKGSQTRRH